LFAVFSSTLQTLELDKRLDARSASRSSLK
jgi:hypothetical protein